MFYIIDVECQDFFGSYVALEVNNIAHNILGFLKIILSFLHPLVMYKSYIQKVYISLKGKYILFNVKVCNLD